MTRQDGARDGRRERAIPFSPRDWFDVAQKDQRRPATSRVSWYFLQRMHQARQRAEPRMDGQTESFAAVAAAVSFLFSLSMLSAVAKPSE